MNKAIVIGAATILSLPVLGLLALLVRLKLGWPVLFRQQRPGRHGQPFTILKFRTMLNARDARGRLLPDAQRLTPFGNFLRRNSLDELPGGVPVIGPGAVPFGDKLGAGIKHFVLQMARGELGANGIPGQLEKFNSGFRRHDRRLLRLVDDG